jgi:CheY-like chemotaxis protein
VDDESSFRFAAVVALRKGGYRVEDASDGKEALRKVRAARDAKDPFHLVVTDILMPVMSGIELIDALREEGVDTRLCAITCFGEQALVEDLARIGCTEYIEKPFSPEMLLARLGEILERQGG